METLPWYLFAFTLAWAVAMTTFCFYRNPLPFPDRGHRCFAVPNKHAANVVVSILGEIGGLPERFSFAPGPTHQTLLWDNTTVIIYHDEIIREQKISPNGLSIAVSNPRFSAQKAAEMLKKSGFTAIIREDVIPEAGDKFVILISNAFDDWILAFRRHILFMGKLPKKHKLLP